MIHFVIIRNLPYSADFEAFFDGSKSFSNKVYNQQFKGTLRSVSRLFSLTHDPRCYIMRANQLVLKYDQPLYSLCEMNINFSSYHEELVQNTSIPKIHHFLNDNDIGPLYAGWDEKLRKFVITNKFLPRTVGWVINLI